MVQTTTMTTEKQARQVPRPVEAAGASELRWVEQPELRWVEQPEMRWVEQPETLEHKAHVKPPK